MIPPEMLSGVNYERPEKVERLAASMRAHGWQGRPLLVEEGSTDGSSPGPAATESPPRRRQVSLRFRAA